MNYVKTHWFIFSLGFVFLLVIVSEVSLNFLGKRPLTYSHAKHTSSGPDINRPTDSTESALIGYGKELITHTSTYFGLRGTIGSTTNGLNCENCHLEGGTKLNTNNFLAVASTYPKYKARSGRVESIEFRVNDCLQRSLNGEKIDSTCKEMKAMVAYIRWTGIHAGKDKKDKAVKSNDLAFLDRAADPGKGRVIFVARCKSCHGENGQGICVQDSVKYIYPPLWGKHSYAVSAGMYRITKLASFIKYNMPLGATYQKPQVMDEEAWDLAAYINSQPHPQKIFAYDWPKLNTKPVDYPFGPYADKFSEKQHKYGPFKAMLPGIRK